MVVAGASLPVAKASPALAEAWERVCALVRGGTGVVHAASMECAGLGLSGPAAYERARRIPALYGAYLAAKEAWYHALQAELRALGKLPEMAPADRVRAQVIQWDLSKLEPTRWGDRTQLDIAGQGGAPIPLAVHITAGDARHLARDPEEDP